MKILKLKLYQQTACYKKPFAFKVAETYPLPPYSTVIGMFHKILQANPGQYFDMNISIQGKFEGIFSNYQNLRMYKGNDKVTSMPRNVHQLLDVELLIHVQAEDEIIDKIYYNITHGVETFTLGRNEDTVRVDEIKYVNNTHIGNSNNVAFKYNSYIPIKDNNYEDEEDRIKGINYRLNTTYTIDKDNLRRWKKVDVVYIDANSLYSIENPLLDEDNNIMLFYK